MRKKSFLAVGFVLIGVVSLVSYMALGNMNSADKPHAISNSENSSSPVTIRVETDKSLYKLGEIVRMKVFLVNRSNDTLKIGPVNFGYTVFDSRGKGLISVDTRNLYASDTPFILPPYGDILLTDLLGWGQHFMRPEGSAFVTETVPPGTYTILVETSGAIQATAEVTATIGGS